MNSSLTLRLAALVGLLGLVQAAAVLGFSYVTLRNELAGQQRAVLRDKVEQARQLIGTLQDAPDLKANAFRLFELVKGQSDLHMAVGSSDSSEAQVAFSREASESLQRLKQDVWGTDAYLEWEPSGHSTTMLSLASTATTTNLQDFELVLSVDRSKDLRPLRKLLLTALTGAPFALAMVMIAAFGVVALGLRPLVHFRHAVSGVRANRLDARLDPASLPRELQELAAAFNAMLERLGDSVTRLQQFSADLAHEMRTPLSTLLGRTQVALSRGRDADELKDVLVHNVEELQRLARLISDMLFLAQADNAQQALRLERVELAAEAVRIADFLAIAAEEKDVQVCVNGSAWVHADRGLVQRALTNLLSNAVRHARADSHIAVDIEVRAGVTRVAVENEGEAIAGQHLERLFERFYRADAARHRNHGGTGLGLAIVKAIMALHGGSSEVKAIPPDRVRFTLRFPADGERAGLTGATEPVSEKA